MTKGTTGRIRESLALLCAWKMAQGLSLTTRWASSRFAVMLGMPEPQVWYVHPRQALAPLGVRRRGCSDVMVFTQIFIFREYQCLDDLRDPHLVLDLGANVGFSSAYFLSMYPRSRVVAVEPDPGNFACCEANLSSYGDRVMLVHGAAWASRKELRLLDPNNDGGREWSFQVREAGDIDKVPMTIQGWDIDSLISLSGGDSVDLLKIDIERAELSVFGSSSKSWLRRVRNICIELHGKDCEEVFFAALQEFDFEVFYSGELTICRNLRPKQDCSHSSSDPLLIA